MIPTNMPEWPSSSDIDNVLSEGTMTMKPLTEVSNNDIVARPTPDEVDVIAAKIGNQLGSDAGHHPFICKAIWELGAENAQRLADIASKGRTPANYFSWLAKKSIEELSLI